MSAIGKARSLPLGAEPVASGGISMMPAPPSELVFLRRFERRPLGHSRRDNPCRSDRVVVLAMAVNVYGGEMTPEGAYAPGVERHVRGVEYDGPSHLQVAGAVLRSGWKARPDAARQDSRASAPAKTGLEAAPGLT
jgi:hypothetical protein